MDDIWYIFFSFIHYTNSIHNIIYDLFVEFVFCLLFSIIIIINSTLLWHSRYAMLMMGDALFVYMYIFSKFWTIDAYYFTHYTIHFIQVYKQKFYIKSCLYNHDDFTTVWIFSFHDYYYDFFCYYYWHMGASLLWN